MEKPGLFLLSPMLHQGGFERVCVTTARVLEKDFDITIVIFDDKDIAYDIEGLKIINLNLPVRQGKVGKLLNIFKRRKALKKLKKEYKPLLCYSFGPTANIVNAFSRTKDTGVWLGFRSYGDLFSKRLLKVFNSRADRIICCAKEIEYDFKKMFPGNRAVTLYNLFNTELIEESAKEEVNGFTEGKKVFISMGRDDEVKGFWHMIKAFSLVHEKYPETELKILGDGTFEECRELAGKLLHDESVFFEGMCTNPYKYLSRSDIYLLTSSVEGFPNALVEGMILSLAPIATNCPSGPSEILIRGDRSTVSIVNAKLDSLKSEGKKPILSDECGIMIPVLDGKADYSETITDEDRLLAEAMEYLLENPEILKDYQTKARQRALEFGYDAYVDNFKKIYEGIK
ncbi:MAG: glycosyltransferase [Lachnospiraceae bacterium]|nr:glycosyltransferase [Lachnospiraceae bacterium]